MFDFFVYFGFIKIIQIFANNCYLVFVLLTGIITNLNICSYAKTI